MTGFPITKYDQISLAPKSSRRLAAGCAPARRADEMQDSPITFTRAEVSTYYELASL